MTLERPAVVATLLAIGLFPGQAEPAAADPRIAWTEEMLAACVAYVKASTATKPGAVLWTQFLQHGRTPPVLQAVPTPDPFVAQLVALGLTPAQMCPGCWTVVTGGFPCWWCRSEEGKVAA